MKKTVYFGDFEESFVKMGRGEQFSYEALKAIFDYYIEFEEATGIEVELDVIAICCEWSEYEPEDFKDDYPEGYEGDVIELDNSILIKE